MGRFIFIKSIPCSLRFKIFWRRRGAGWGCTFATLIPSVLWVIIKLKRLWQKSITTVLGTNRWIYWWGFEACPFRNVFIVRCSMRHWQGTLVQPCQAATPNLIKTYALNKYHKFRKLATLIDLAKPKSWALIKRFTQKKINSPISISAHQMKWINKPRKSLYGNCKQLHKSQFCKSQFSLVISFLQPLVILPMQLMRKRWERLEMSSFFLPLDPAKKMDCFWKANSFKPDLCWTWKKIEWHSADVLTVDQLLSKQVTPKVKQGQNGTWKPTKLIVFSFYKFVHSSWHQKFLRTLE